VQAADGLILVGNSGLVLTQDQVGNFSSTNHSGGGDFASVVATGTGFLLVGEDGVHNYPETAETETD
jgi:hypothetical protein